MYFSLAPNPGYDNSVLATRGIDGEFTLFTGNLSQGNNGTGGTWSWGSGNHSIGGKLDSLRKIIIIFF